ncbi:MAG: hypothetical protein ACJ71U_22460 [Terriglobales bacterium]
MRGKELHRRLRWKNWPPPLSLRQIARHLPEPVQKSIEVLPKLQKQQVMEQLLEMKNRSWAAAPSGRRTILKAGKFWMQMATARVR